MKTFVSLFLVGFLLCRAALAESDVRSDLDCAPLRTAKAYVSVYKYFWVLEAGIWNRKSQEVANNRKNPSDVPVVQINSGRCHFHEVMRVDQLPLNGHLQTVQIYAHIDILNPGSPHLPRKDFYAGYSVGASKIRHSFAAAYTPDLNLNEMGVNFSSEAVSSGTISHQDTFDVVIWFRDNVSK